MPPRRIAVCLEVTAKQAIASALEWPGWCRVGRDEGAASAALASYAGGTRLVAAHAVAGFAGHGRLRGRRAGAPACL